MPTLGELNSQLKSLDELLAKAMPPATRASLLRAQMALKTRKRLVQKRMALGERSKASAVETDDKTKAALAQRAEREAAATAKKEAAKSKAFSATVDSLIAQDRGPAPAKPAAANPQPSTAADTKLR